MIIPEELVERLQQGEVVLFIGAGISRNAGLPGWVELIQPLSGLAGSTWPSHPEDVNTEHLLTAARYYENKFGRNALIRILQDKLDTTAIAPSDVHYLMTLLPTDLIFTTNYDDLLERTCQKALIPFRVIASGQELPYWREGHIQIIKLCGDLSRPDSIQITKSDFNIYAETHNRLIESLRTTLETRTALFLGYSMHDPFLNQIWDSIALHVGRHQRTAYAVFFDLSALEAEDLKIRNINPIELHDGGRPRQEVLIEFLATLAGRTGKINPERLEKILPHISDPDAAKLLTSWINTR